MIGRLVNMTWNDVMESDLVFKVNTLRHVVELDGAEVGLPTSSVVMYYNRITGKVNVAHFSFNELYNDINLKNLDEYAILSDIKVDDAGTPYTEITCVHKNVIRIIDGY